MGNKQAPTSEKTINREEIRKSIEGSSEFVERERKLEDQAKKKLLRDRAAALAGELKDEEIADEYLDVVEFLLSYETYYVESVYIGEIYPLHDYTPVPCTPSFVLGIINVRGKILSVIDIRKFFDLPEKGLTNLNQVIILHSEKMEFGVLADAVTGVRRIPLREIQPSLPTLTGLRAEYLKGITKEGSIVIDAEKILSDEKIIVNEEVEP